MSDPLWEFWDKMRESDDYLRMDELKNRHCYKIWARNAYVGVWIEEMQGFLISRYKLSRRPRPFVEYHWDIGEPFGTVKPIELIEPCPFAIEDPREPAEREALLAYLDDLEEANPLVEGVNTLAKRRASVARFGDE